MESSLEYPVAEHWETEARVAQAAAVRERDRAVAAESALETRNLQFAGAEHRIKNSLLIVQGWAATLKSRWADIGDDERREGLAAINRGAERAIADTQFLLDQARTEHGRLDLNLTVLDLRPAVSRMVSDASGLSSRHDFHVDADTTPVLATADPAVLETVLGHLLENAVKYSPRGGRIIARCHVVGSHPGILVEDQGLGVPQGVDVFAPFERGVDAKTDNGADIPGSGLGLWLVKSLVDAIGGSIFCWPNDPPPGSTFLVRLLPA